MQVKVELPRVLKGKWVWHCPYTISGEGTLFCHPTEEPSFSSAGDMLTSYHEKLVVNRVGSRTYKALRKVIPPSHAVDPDGNLWEYKHYNRVPRGWTRVTERE